MAKLAFALGEAHFKECQRSCDGTPSPQWPASRLPKGGVTHLGLCGRRNSQHGGQIMAKHNRLLSARPSSPFSGWWVISEGAGTRNQSPYCAELSRFAVR